ncbi:MAG: FAD:protein FMN transferase [Candidatus Nanopelagicales bacterium]|nr:FAD:protein FMN transferase [Candidatus Nanopelagicales bacterium]
MQRVIADVDRSCSAYRDDSDLSAVNRAQGCWTQVGPVFLDVLTEALAMADATGGLADPTVGTATLATTNPVPVTVHPHADWRGVDVDLRQRRVRLRRGLSLDLGAIAKAHCADRAASAAHSATGGTVLVCLLGDIAVAGEAPDGGWPVVCADDHRGAADLPGDPGARVHITTGGLATSSLTVRRGVHGNHVVDPRTLRPVQGPVRTASVAALTCAHANAAATAALVRGPSARHWLEGLGLPARLVHEDGQVEMTGGWPQ